MCEPRNRDNGASDLWTLTAYWVLGWNPVTGRRILPYFGKRKHVTKMIYIFCKLLKWVCQSTLACLQYAAVKAQTSLAPLSCLAGSRGLIRMRTNIVYFRVMRRLPSRMKLTMKLTMREPASMTTDTWSRRVTSDFNSVFAVKIRRHTPCSRGPLSWIPGMLVHALSISLSISFATAQSSHNSEIYNIGARAQ